MKFNSIYDRPYYERLKDVIIYTDSKPINIQAIVNLYNLMCEETLYDDYIHSMEELNAVFACHVPYDVIQATQYDFNLSDKYFWIDSDGSAHSTNNPIIEDFFDDGALALYLIESDDYTGIPAIDGILQDLRNNNQEEGDNE